MNQSDFISDSEKSSTGLDPIVAATLAYAFVFISGLIFVLFEKQSKYVRFHALQSTFLFMGLFVLQAFFGVIPLVGWFGSFAITPIAVILWIVLMVQAYRGQKFKIPVVGDLAEKYA